MLAYPFQDSNIALYRDKKGNFNLNTTGSKTSGSICKCFCRLLGRLCHSQWADTVLWHQDKLLSAHQSEISFHLNFCTYYSLSRITLIFMLLFSSRSVSAPAFLLLSSKVKFMVNSVFLQYFHHIFDWLLTFVHCNLSNFLFVFP